MFSAFQSVILGDPGSNCGTQKTIKIALTDDVINLFRYRYIKEGSKLILLDKDNLAKYKNKFVEMRTPLYCTNNQVCSKCAGELYYKLNIRNAGLTAGVLTSAILNLNMKKMHDTTVKTSTLTISDCLK